MEVSWFEIIVLAIVEGITEFLPISSTGHMIITQNLMEIPPSEALEAFLVIVQSGAILAVITLFWPTFFGWLKAWVTPKAVENARGQRLESIYMALAVVPFGAVGFTLRHFIKSLFSVQVVAYALIVGAILIFISERFIKNAQERPASDFKLKDALLIGCGQCLALWPGFSRSAATIITSRLLGYSRTSAAKFSFLIGVPTLLGAATYEAIKDAHHLTGAWLQYVVVGILVAWVVAYFCAKWFVAFLQRYSMNVFAMYRIIVGVFLLWYFRT